MQTDTILPEMPNNTTTTIKLTITLTFWKLTIIFNIDIPFRERMMRSASDCTTGGVVILCILGAHAMMCEHSINSNWFYPWGTINHTVHCRTARRITYSLRIVTYQTCLVCVGWHSVSNVRVRTDSNPNLAVVVCRLQFHLCPQIVKFDVGNNIVVLVNNTRTNCFINFRCNDPCRWFGCFLYGRKSM